MKSTHSALRCGFLCGHLGSRSRLVEWVESFYRKMAARRIGQFVPDWIKIATKVPNEAKPNMNSLRMQYETIKTRWGNNTVMNRSTCISCRYWYNTCILIQCNVHLFSNSHAYVGFYVMFSKSCVQLLYFRVNATAKLLIWDVFNIKLFFTDIVIDLGCSNVG